MASIFLRKYSDLCRLTEDNVIDLINQNSLKNILRVRPMMSQEIKLLVWDVKDCSNKKGYLMKESVRVKWDLNSQFIVLFEKIGCIYFTQNRDN